MMLLRHFATALGAAIVLCVLFNMPASAAEAEWPGFAVLRTTQVHAGKGPAYEDFWREIKAEAERANWPTGINVQTGIAGPGGLYTSLTFHTDFNDLGRPGFIADAKWRQMLEGLNGVVKESQVQILLRRPDLGWENPNLDVSKVDAWWIYLVTVHNNSGPQFVEYMHKLVEATEKIDPNAYWSGYSPFQYSTNLFRFAAPLTFDGMNTPPMSIPQRLVQAFGEEEAQRLFALNNEAVVSLEQRLMRQRHDLSYVPAQ